MRKPRTKRKTTAKSKPRHKHTWKSIWRGIYRRCTTCPARQLWQDCYGLAGGWYTIGGPRAEIGEFVENHSPINSAWRRGSIIRDSFWDRAVHHEKKT